MAASSRSRDTVKTSTAAPDTTADADELDDQVTSAASDTDTGSDDDGDLSNELDRATEKTEVAERRSVEDRRDAVMREFSLLAPDDYRARMRAQTHVAAAELRTDETRPGGLIIDRRGRKVDANGKRI